MDTPELSHNAAKTRHEEQKPVEVTTAFLIAVTPEGTVQVIPDINAPIIPQRPPLPDEIKRMCWEVYESLRTQEIAGTVINAMNQFGQAMAEQAKNSELLNRIGHGKADRRNNR